MPVILWTVAASSIFWRVVVAAPGQELPPLPGPVEVVRDSAPGSGPLAGIADGLRALRLVHYASPDLVAFYALQRGPVFDAGTDVQRMIAWKHLGPSDRSVNLLEAVDAQALGAGFFVLWVNQTGIDLTKYAIEIEIGVP